VSPELKILTAVFWKSASENPYPRQPTDSPQEITLLTSSRCFDRIHHETDQEQEGEPWEDM